ELAEACSRHLAHLAPVRTVGRPLRATVAYHCTPVRRHQACAATEPPRSSAHGERQALGHRQDVETAERASYGLVDVGRVAAVHPRAEQVLIVGQDVTTTLAPGALARLEGNRLHARVDRLHEEVFVDDGVEDHVVNHTRRTPSTEGDSHVDFADVAELGANLQAISG